ncbi:MAG: quinol:electron acceptor oxidoreductase subunit ActD [Anaerolineales bacterium]
MDEATELIALFRKPADTADAIDALLAAGVSSDQIVVMSGVPYPEGALGRHVEWTRLPYIVIAGALGGMLFGLFLAVITPHLYRLDVGGHPPVGFPPAAIIIFVFTMMATIISTFLGVLWEMNFPEFGPKAYDKRVTDGDLAVLVEFPDDLTDKVHKLLERYGARDIRTPEPETL